jgi:hypothetical protein
MTRKRKRGNAKGSAVAPKSAVTVAAMPSAWDMGATGPANRAWLVTEERGETDPETGEKRNPNNVQGVRRIDNIEVWHNCFIGGKYNRAWITTEQYNAAIDYRDAFEATMLAPGTDYARPIVDSSPKPDHAVTIQMDRIARYERAARSIAPQDRPILWHCVIMGGLPSTLRINGQQIYQGDGFEAGYIALRAALDRLARNGA